MRILITGGVGFLGTNIATLALNQGHKVIAFDSLIRNGVETNILEHPNYTLIRGDIRNEEDFLRIPDVDGIINLAANPGVPWSIHNPIYDFNANAKGALNVLEFARTHGNIPVIQASTNKVYSEKINDIKIKEKKTRYVVSDKRFFNGISENFPIDGIGEFGHSPYGCSKYAADVYCQEYYQIFKTPTVVNRMSCIYGKYQHGVADQGWVAWFIIAKVLGRPLEIFGDGKQVRDVLYGEDVARLYLSQLENIEAHKGKVYNIGGGPKNTTSLLELIEILDNTGINGNSKYPPLKLEFKDWRPCDHKVYISDISKIEPYWKPTTPFATGVMKTYEWIERNMDVVRRVL